MNDTIFHTKSLSRQDVKWENYLEALTPVERRGRTYFKREDYFAPLGYGSINGAKLRQLIYLVTSQLMTAPETRGILSGSVAGSPQHPMVAAVAAHFGLMAVLIVGARGVAGHPNLELAERFGASFQFMNVGYARALESTVFKMRDTDELFSDFYALETNITLTTRHAAPEAVSAFHDAAAVQVTNLPPEVTRIVMPCGSAISATSVLSGLARFPDAHNVSEVVLMGIGNVGSTDLSYLYDRLELTAPYPADYFSRPNAPGGAVHIRHIDLNGAGFCRYSDLMPFRYEGIRFHPRYEGKVMNWIERHEPELLDDRTVFWIVGSEPS